MRLIRWKRIGQSGQELVAAILFSFVIHGLLLAAVLLFSLAASPKFSVPVSYQVKLVSAPTAIEPAQPTEAPPPQKKTSPKTRFAAPMKKPPAAAKSVIPDLGASKAAQKKIEPQPETPKEKEKPAAPSGTASPGEAAENKEAVAVSAGQQNQLPGLAGYLPLVREKISRNWNPPPGVREAKAKITFRILRSGRAVDVKLAAASGNFYFDQAANRSILSSSPFPQLPDECPRESIEVSVDLAEKN